MYNIQQTDLMKLEGNFSCSAPKTLFIVLGMSYENEEIVTDNSR